MACAAYEGSSTLSYTVSLANQKHVPPPGTRPLPGPVPAGVLFGLPMPVQPMKAIAAVAIASDPAIGVPVIMAGGLLMSLALLLLSVTGGYTRPNAQAVPFR